MNHDMHIFLGQKNILFVKVSACIIRHETNVKENVYTDDVCRYFSGEKKCEKKDRNFEFKYKWQ